MCEISIITINLNNAEGLEKTINSVISQSKIDFEYIVIDGGSTDKSINVIESFNDEINIWISEPDYGIYNAMNKGLRKASGNYCIFLNSGDYLVENYALYKLLKEGNSKDLIYGNIKIDDGMGGWVKSYPSSLDFSYFLKDTLPHMATLIKRQILCKNPYNEENKIVSDWEFFIHSVCYLNVSYKYVNSLISVFNLEGISSDLVNSELIMREKNIFLKKKFSAFLKDYENMDLLHNKFKTNSLWHFSKSIVKKLLV